MTRRRSKWRIGPIPQARLRQVGQSIDGERGGRNVVFVCLAAGRGRRMEPLTTYLHKAMIPFSGIPLLAYSLLSIPRQAEVVMVVNYLSDQITGYFGRCYMGRNITYFEQVDPKGTGDALFQVFQCLRPKLPTVVWQADQLMFPWEIDMLCDSEPNVAICSRTTHGIRDVWAVEAFAQRPAASKGPSRGRRVSRTSNSSGPRLEEDNRPASET